MPASATSLMALYPQDPASYTQFANYMARMMVFQPLVPVQEQPKVQQQVLVLHQQQQGFVPQQQQSSVQPIAVLALQPVQPMQAQTQQPPAPQQTVVSQVIDWSTQIADVMRN